MIAIGNVFWDVSKVTFLTAPNGTIDAPIAWTVDPPELQANLAIAADNLSASIQVDSDVAAFAVTAQAPADNPTTPELESVAETWTGSFSHSKATSLGGSFSIDPRT